MIITELQPNLQKHINICCCSFNKISIKRKKLRCKKVVLLCFRLGTRQTTSKLVLRMATTQRHVRGLSHIVIKTLRRASVLSSDRRGFMVSICVEISWTCLGGWKDVLFVASLASCCRGYSLIWLLLLKFVWV